MNDQDVFKLCVSGTSALVFFIWFYLKEGDLKLSLVITACLFLISCGMWV